MTYGFALNASRGLATDPLLVRFSGTDVPTWRRAVAPCAGAAAATGRGRSLPGRPVRSGPGRAAGGGPDPASLTTAHASLCVLFTIALTLFGLAWGVFLLVALPRGLGQWMLGSLWRPTYPLVLPTTLFVMGGCASSGAGMWLHALGAARRSLRAAMLTSVVYVVFALAGAFTGGAVGSIRGAAAGTWIGALVYRWQLRKALQEPSQAAAAPETGPGGGTAGTGPGSAATAFRAGSGTLANGRCTFRLQLTAGLPEWPAPQCPWYRFRVARRHHHAAAPDTKGRNYPSALALAGGRRRHATGTG